MQSVRLECTVHNPILTDGPTWDCAAVSLRAIDQNGNLLPYCGEAVQLRVEGRVAILGPSVVPLRGGMAGTYLATTGEAGRAVLHCQMEGALDTEAVPDHPLPGGMQQLKSRLFHDRFALCSKFSHGCMVS
ncbi:MAG: hypothetical protein ACLUGP_09035 [Faecalibacterium prausnitzii]